MFFLFYLFLLRISYALIFLNFTKLSKNKNLASGIFFSRNFGLFFLHSVHHFENSISKYSLRHVREIVDLELSVNEKSLLFDFFHPSRRDNFRTYLIVFVSFNYGISIILFFECHYFSPYLTHFQLHFVLTFYIKFQITFEFHYFQ